MLQFIFTNQNILTHIFHFFFKKKKKKPDKKSTFVENDKSTQCNFIISVIFYVINVIQIDDKSPLQRPVSHGDECWSMNIVNCIIYSHQT